MTVIAQILGNLVAATVPAASYDMHALFWIRARMLGIA